MSSVVNIQYSTNQSSNRGYYSQTNGYNYMSYVGREDAHREPDFFKSKNQAESEMFFNHLGKLHKNQVNEIKNFLRQTEGTIWYGVFDTDKAHADRLDSIIKATYCVESVFPQFFESIGGSGMDISNLYFFCALHTNTKDHPHVHFAFTEREKKFYSNTGELCYRQSPKIPEESLKLLRDEINAYIERPRSLNLDEQIYELKKLNAGKVVDYRAKYVSHFIKVLDSVGSSGITNDDLTRLICFAKQSSPESNKAFNACFKAISQLSSKEKRKAKESLLSSISSYFGGYMNKCDEREKIKEMKKRHRVKFGNKKLLKFLRIHKRKAEYEAKLSLKGFPEFMRKRESEIKGTSNVVEYRDKQHYRGGRV